MNFDTKNIKKSKHLALLLGMFAGDGCLPIKHNGDGNRVYPILFYNTDKYLIRVFHKLFRELFGTKGKIRQRKRKGKLILYEFEKYSVDLFRIFESDFEMFPGKKARNVRIPSFIMAGSSEMKKYFFLGLLITDGGIKKKKTIIFHLASSGLITDLQLLIKDVWGFERPVKKYIQQEIFVSYQLTLNTNESYEVLSNMPRSHNLVLRRF